jgi:abortive infection bacteriophage resistance protein
MDDGSAMRQYDKPPLPLDDQVQKLIERGMTIKNLRSAEQYLGIINYYRFVGYGLPFEEIDATGVRLDHYKPGTRFEDVVTIYNFDSQLRLLLWQALEKVEITFRTAVCYIMSTAQHDPFWYQDRTLFHDANAHNQFLAKCQDEFDREKPEAFIRHYKRTYDCHRLPPCWMMIEIVSFATWSKVYENLRHQSLKKQIAAHMGMNARYLESWIRAAAVTRNLCAHHHRMWNRVMPMQPSISPRMTANVLNPQKVGAVILVLRELLHPQGAGDKFMGAICGLLNGYPSIDQAELGLKEIPIIKGPGQHR